MQNMNMRRYVAPVLLALSAAPTLRAQSTPTECRSEIAAQQEFQTFGALLLRLTRDQVYAAADAKYLIGLKALEKGWSSADEQAFITKFLTSQEYGVLQQEREPHRAAIAQAQTLWRTQATVTSAQSLCDSVRAAKTAVEKSYEINKREHALLVTMLSRE